VDVWPRHRMCLPPEPDTSGNATGTKSLDRLDSSAPRKIVVYIISHPPNEVNPKFVSSTVSAPRIRLGSIAKG